MKTKTNSATMEKKSEAKIAQEKKNQFDKDFAAYKNKLVISYGWKGYQIAKYEGSGGIVLHEFETFYQAEDFAKDLIGIYKKHGIAYILLSK